MNWDDLRFVVAVAKTGSLLSAARELHVQHTTVGRRISAAEKALGAKLFARSTSGLVLTAEGERLVEPLQKVEDAVSALLRRASAEHEELVGTVKVTAPETFGVAWLAPRLALLARQHTGLRIELDPSGQVLDLGRREAEIAVRFFRSKQKNLVMRKVATLRHGLYASASHLARYPVRAPKDLRRNMILAVPPGSVEAHWLERLTGGAPPSFTCTVTLALVEAAKAGAGIAVLPRYLGDLEPDLQYLPMPDEPEETLWLTVHRDLRSTPRVRVVMDYLIQQFERDALGLRGR